MSNHSLTIVFEDSQTFRWQLLEVDGESLLPGSVSQCSFDTYAAALNAGTLALAAADRQPYENEAADPVGDADCAPDLEA